MENIDIEKLENFINENKEKQVTTQDIGKDILRIKHSILLKVNKQLNESLERNDSAMVAAIAEILKNF